MCTGAWLRATRAIISRNCCMTVERPISLGPCTLMVGVPSARIPSRIALPTSLRSTLRSSGFETKSNAPSFSARTADSTLPWAVMTATGTLGWFSWIQATRSRPSPSGRRMSVRQRSKLSDLSRRRAVATSGAVRVSRFIRLNVRLTSSSRSGSSSTISTTGRLDELRLRSAGTFI